MIGSTVVHNNIYFLFLSSRSISGGFYLVYYSPCIIMWRSTIFVLLDFLRWLLIRFSVRPGQVFRNPCFIALKRLAVFGLKSSAWRYCASSGLDIWAIMLSVTAYDCCFSRSYSYIPVILFLVPLIISCLFLWTDVSCFSSVMLHT